jgi:hypothetical protein
MSDLLRRANAFERAALAGHHVPKRVIVRPYQVTSNLPRRREVIDQRQSGCGVTRGCCTAGRRR